MKEEIGKLIRSYTLGEITLEECVEAIYKTHKMEAQTFSLILLAIVVVASMIL